MARQKILWDGLRQFRRCLIRTQMNADTRRLSCCYNLRISANICVRKKVCMAGQFSQMGLYSFLGILHLTVYTFPNCITILQIVSGHSANHIKTICKIVIQSGKVDFDIIFYGSLYCDVVHKISVRLINRFKKVNTLFPKKY